MNREHCNLLVFIICMAFCISGGTLTSAEKSELELREEAARCREEALKHREEALRLREEAMKHREEAQRLRKAQETFEQQKQQDIAHKAERERRRLEEEKLRKELQMVREKQALLEAREKDKDWQLEELANLSEEARLIIGDLPQWKDLDKEVQALKAMDVGKEYASFTEKAEKLKKSYVKIIEGDARTWKELENRMNASNRLANSSWNRELLRQLHEKAQERLGRPRKELQAQQRRKLQKETEEFVSAMEMVADESVKLLESNKISQLVNINQKRDKVCQYLAHCTNAYLKLEDDNLKNDVKSTLLGPIGQRKADFARTVKGSLDTNAKQGAYEQLMDAFEKLIYVLNNNQRDDTK